MIKLTKIDPKNIKKFWVEEGRGEDPPTPNTYQVIPKMVPHLYPFSPLPLGLGPEFFV